MKTAWAARTEEQIPWGGADRADIVLETSVHMIEQINHIGWSHVWKVVMLRIYRLIPRLREPTAFYRCSLRVACDLRDCIGWSGFEAGSPLARNKALHESRLLCTLYPDHSSSRRSHHRLSPTHRQEKAPQKHPNLILRVLWDPKSFHR